MNKSVLGKLADWIKGFDNKKIIEYLVLIGILGIVIIITANSLWGNENKGSTTPIQVSKQVRYQTVNDLNYGLEKKVAQILSEIQGVGRVAVLITYESGPQNIFVKDSKENESQTFEKGTGGGERRIQQKELENKLVFADEQNGIKKPVVLKQIAPEVMGVVVVADGANDPSVCSSIVRAVKAVTGVEEHRIQVFKMR